MQSNDRKIVKNTIFLYIRMVLVLGISLFTTREVLNALGIEDFGIYNVVAGFVSMFAFMTNMMSNATLRFYNNRIGAVGEDGIKVIYNISIFLMVSFYVVMLLVLETIGIWYINNKMTLPVDRLYAANWLFQFSIISMGFTMLDVPFRASILAHEKMGFFSIVSIVDAIMKLLIVYLLFVSETDLLVLYGFMMMCIAMLNLVMDFMFCRRNYQQMRLNFKIDKSLFKEMFSFLGWSTLGNFSFMLKEQGVNMILNLFFGPIVNAARGITMQVVAALQQFVTNNNIAVTPQMTQSYARGEYKRAVNLFLTVSKLNFTLFFIVALPVSLEIDYILNLWLDGVVPEHTSSFVVLVLICYIINNWNSPLSNLFYATGKMRNYQLASLIILSLVPITYFAFWMGACAEWAFILTILISLIHHAVGLLILKRILPFSLSIYMKKVVLPALYITFLSIGVPVLFKSFLDESLFRLIIVSICSICSVAIFAYYIYMNQEERRSIVSLIRKRMNFSK